MHIDNPVCVFMHVKVEKMCERRGFKFDPNYIGDACIFQEEIFIDLSRN